MSQSSNPFKPDYVDPWHFRVLDFIPNWIFLIAVVIDLTGIAFMLAGGLHALFCCC